MSLAFIGSNVAKNRKQVIKNLRCDNLAAPNGKIHAQYAWPQGILEFIKKYCSYRACLLIRIGLEVNDMLAVCGK